MVSFVAEKASSVDSRTSVPVQPDVIVKKLGSPSSSPSTFSNTFISSSVASVDTSVFLPQLVSLPLSLLSLLFLPRLSWWYLPLFLRVWFLPFRVPSSSSSFGLGFSSISFPCSFSYPCFGLSFSGRVDVVMGDGLPSLSVSGGPVVSKWGGVGVSLPIGVF